MTVFDPDDRERIAALLVEAARGDARLIGAAAVGSSATGRDRWSDLDLTFAVAAGVPLSAVLADWTRRMVDDHGAAVLCDMTAGAAIYRVFLLPGMLQVDLSFSPAAEFGARGPRFRLLFGEAKEHPKTDRLPADHLFGLGVLYALHGNVCVERGRYWQAEYFVHQVRDVALTLACRRLGLPEDHGRGFDDLPAGLLGGMAGALAAGLGAVGLLRALAVASAGLLQEAGELTDAVGRVRPLLAELLAPAAPAGPLRSPDSGAGTTAPAAAP